MKLRHVLTSVAVTAAIAPAAVFTASAAVADQATPSAGQAAAAATTTPGATVTPVGTATAPPTGSGTVLAARSGTPAKARRCDGTSPDRTNDELVAAVHGVPSAIAAGSGWHGFTLDVDNNSGANYQRVNFLAVVARYRDMTWGYRDTTDAALQVQDPGSGKWIAIALNGGDDEGYLGFRRVKPHQHFSIKLRVGIDSSAPSGSYDYYVRIAGGYIEGYVNGETVCESLGGGPDESQFPILPVGDSPPRTESTGSTASTASTGTRDAGGLAKTGSSSTLPLVAAMGGAAVAVGAGAGAIVVVRRRKAGSHTV